MNGYIVTLDDCVDWLELITGGGNGYGDFYASIDTAYGMEKLRLN